MIFLKAIDETFSPVLHIHKTIYNQLKNEEQMMFKLRFLIIALVLLTISNSNVFSQEKSAEKTKIFKAICGTWEFSYDSDIMVWEIYLDEDLLYIKDEGDDPNPTELALNDLENLEFETDTTDGQTVIFVFEKEDDGKITNCAAEVVGLVELTGVKRDDGQK